jgi:thiosulfate/3-mercaptopyruvate sulfurtransferase
MQPARNWLQPVGQGRQLTHTTLITTAQLAGNLSDPAWLVADCRFELGKPDAGREAWRAGHIPGAIHIDLERDLSAPVTATTGRHPLPPVEDFAATLSRIGVTEQTQVVCYDGSGGAYAARLWWMLRYVGHERVAVLDGGFAAWTGEARPVSIETASRPPSRFVARPRPEMLVDAAGVAAALARGERLVDVRGAERFAGTVEPIDPVAGHVPGAINLPYLENLDERGRFRPPATLAARWRAATGGTSGRDTICMCGSGVTACQGLLALEAAGIRDARLYAGSWSEWIRDPARPVARGAA